MNLIPIAHIRTDFGSKFGIPRQSGMVEELQAIIVFEPKFRVADAVRGLEEFSHVWLIWEFSEIRKTDWQPTVRPPRLGGNVRKGVFGTRSPFRPNPIGLSAVKLDKIVVDKTLGTVLHVSGADLMNGTPIFDIKPYIPYTDCIDKATSGFTDSYPPRCVLEVVFPEELLNEIPKEKQKALLTSLSLDPRPSYQHDTERIYGLTFSGVNVRFRVEAKRLIVVEATPMQKYKQEQSKIQKR